MGGAITLPWQDDNVAEAAEAEDLQQLRWLLDNHGDPNALSRSSGRTALGCVAAGGRSDVVKLLLAARAEVNLCDAGGHCEAGSGSALHHSSSNGWEETSGLLLSHGADPDIYDEMGSTALHIAAVEGRSEVVSVLIDSRANLETKESELASGWRRALHLAVIAGRVEAAKCLLDAKAIVNVAPSSPRSRVTPMHLAAFNGRANLIPLLVEARADPEARVVDGELQLGEEDGEAFPETPLLSAAMANDADACVALLECKALVDTPGAQRRTALMVAAEFQATAALRLLVERGAYLEAKDVQGCTALVQACETRNDEVANLLRELGADTSAKNLSGTTARDLTKLGTGRAIEIPDSCRWFSSCPTAQAQQVRNVVGARNNTIRWLQP